MTQNPPGEGDQAPSPWDEPTAHVPWSPPSPANPAVRPEAPEAEFSPVQPTWHVSQQPGYQPPPPPPVPPPTNVPAWPAAPRQPMPPPVSYPAPLRVEHVPGGPFGVAILPGPRSVSGMSIGSLAAGVGSVLVAAIVWCFGITGAQDGWGDIVSGAFGALSVILGTAACFLGGFALRQTKRQPGMTGRGMALAGLICGAAGIIAAVAGVLLAILLAQQA